LARKLLSGTKTMPRPAARHRTDAKGSYANYFEIGHTAFEFVLGFGEAYDGPEPGLCHTRIVTGPVYALALLDTLNKAVADYQSQFGPIEGAK